MPPGAASWLCGAAEKSAAIAPGPCALRSASGTADALADAWAGTGSLRCPGMRFQARIEAEKKDP
eukprot:3404734-Rhodomonas_salina.2